jgi:hypothetical protein
MKLVLQVAVETTRGRRILFIDTCHSGRSGRRDGLVHTLAQLHLDRLELGSRP